MSTPTDFPMIFRPDATGTCDGCETPDAEVMTFSLRGNDLGADPTETCRWCRTCVDTYNTTMPE